MVLRLVGASIAGKVCEGILRHLEDLFAILSGGCTVVILIGRIRNVLFV